jgi:hypothetical protein
LEYPGIFHHPKSSEAGFFSHKLLTLYFPVKPYKFRLKDLL